MSKPINIAPTPGATFSPPSLITRDWNIPPRPKPGRKPAGDAPPTKRKAQNREAQRAFRERRAARVGELEELLKDYQKTAQRENADLAGEVSRMQNRMQLYTDQISTLQGRQRDLEITLERERQMRQEAEYRVDTMRKGMDANEGVTPLPRRKKTGSERAMDLSSNTVEANPCGKCQSDSRCKCFEDLIDAGFDMDQSGMSNGKPFESNEDPQVSEDNEIDFTMKFASHRSSNAPAPSPANMEPTPRVTDPCGFCRTDSECICAEIARNNAASYLQSPPQDTSRRPSNPSETNGKPSGCTNNPGTCDQCRSNPTSTVFCKTLAATRSQNQQAQVNGAKGPDPGVMEPKVAVAGPTLSCADAFSALSRHHAFPQASEQLGTWVSQLTPIPTAANTQGRTAFEIEAASIMSVLKFFDKRYGQAQQ